MQRVKGEKLGSSREMSFQGFWFVPLASIQSKRGVKKMGGFTLDHINIKLLKSEQQLYEAV